jgi:hypothetical protein
MDRVDVDYFKRNFLVYWLLANAFGLSFGWTAGEWLGIQTASVLGWEVGKVIGFLFFEGSVWVFRWAILFRIRAYDVLKPIDAFIWLSTEMLLWLGLELTPEDTPYREESLFGIVVWTGDMVNTCSET